MRWSPSLSGDWLANVIEDSLASDTRYSEVNEDQSCTRSTGGRASTIAPAAGGGGGAPPCQSNGRTDAVAQARLRRSERDIHGSEQPPFSPEDGSPALRFPFALLRSSYRHSWS